MLFRVMRHRVQLQISSTMDRPTSACCGQKTVAFRLDFSTVHAPEWDADERGIDVHQSREREIIRVFRVPFLKRTVEKTGFGKAGGVKHDER